MIKKGLLSLGFLAAGLAAQAQIPVFHQEFEAAQAADADKTALGWYEFINLQSSYNEELLEENADVWSVTGGVLSISNNAAAECENQSWQRAIKFRNLNLKEGKSYRLSFKLKGSDTFGDNKKCKATACLMQGIENADIEIGDAINIENITSEYPEQPYTKMFYFASKEEQDAKYDAKCAGKEEYNESNKDKYFLTINVYNPGNFEIDDVKLEESSVQSIELGMYVIKVNFGYQTNIAAIASTGIDNIAHISNDCVTVTANGEPVEIDCVELRSNGMMYIFATDAIDSEAEVKVSFKNPGKIEYTGGLASHGAVLDFEDYVATYNEELANDEGENNTHAYALPRVLSTSPVAGSFAMDPSTSEFTVKFNVPVKANLLTATMSNGDKVTVKGVEYSDENEVILDEVTFVREGADLAKGGYTLNIAGNSMYNALNDYHGEDCIIDFEVGKVQLSETIYTDLFTTLLEGANAGQPTGWSIMVGGENWAGGSPKADDGSACRNLNVTGTDGVERTAFYLCDRSGYTYMQYGDQEEKAITIPAGDIAFSLIALSHDDPNHIAEFRLEDMDGNEVAKASGNCGVVANNQFTSIEASDYITVKFNNPTERNLILKVRAPQGGYTAIRVLGFKVQSYKETEGDKSDAVEVFASNFTGANMPAEGSGWLFYNANNELAPGSGRNGTSGMLERNFHAKMPTAAFFRECGDNADAGHRIEYGNGNGVENGFTLEAGSYEITYYAGTWNDNAGNANGTSKVTMQFIDTNSGEIVFEDVHVNKANFENGGACNGQADKVVKAFNTNGGTFSIKAWGTHNTVWGGLTIVKEGSKAAKYTQMLTDALAVANDELAKSEDAAFDGTTKVQLGEAITKYSAEDLDMHTPAEYTAAVEELNGLAEAINARRENVGTYNKAKSDIAGFIEGIAEKCNALDCVIALKDVYATYENTEAVEVVDDAELAAAAANLTKNYELSKHMTGEGVETLTQQIVELAKQLIALDENVGDGDNDVIAAYNAITDDQEIANNLQKRITAAIYEKCAAEEDPFSSTELDPDLMEEVTTETPFDATWYVQNPRVYCVSEKHEPNTIANFPGWNIEEGKETFGLRPNYGWGGWTGSATHLVNKDMFLGIGWVGNDGVNVWSNVNNLPVGIYDLTIETMDRSGVGTKETANDDGTTTKEENVVTDPEKQQSYIYIQNGEEEAVTKAFNVENIGQYYGFTPDKMEKISIKGEVTASAKIGAYIHAQESFAAIQRVSLSLKAKDPNFDYAAAAAALKDEIVTAIKNEAVVAVGAPVSVKYYDLNGVQTKAPKGACIKIETYKNGAKVIKKAIM